MAMMRDKELADLATILARDTGMKITIGGTQSYCTANGDINISRMPATPLGQLLMTGLIFHENGHKLHSDYSVIPSPGLLKEATNVFEDLRVEAEVIRERPGTKFNLDGMNDYFFQKGALTPTSGNLNEALLGKALAYCLRKYRGCTSVQDLEAVCNEAMDDAFGEDFITDAESICDEFPSCKDTGDIIALAKKYIDLLIQQKTPPPPHPPPSSQPQPQEAEEGNGEGNKEESQAEPGDDSQEDNDGDGQGDQDGDGEQSPGADEPQGNGNGEDESQSQNGGGSDGNGQGEDSPGNEKQNSDQGEEEAQSGGNGAGNGGGRRPTPEEIEKMLAEETGFGDKGGMLVDELNELAHQFNSDEVAGSPELPKIGVLKSRFGKLDEIEAISATSRMRSKIIGMLQSIGRKPEQFGASGKKLATGRLHRLAIGDPKIFKRKEEVKTVNTAVCILLDLSGSMDGNHLIANPASFALHNTLYGLKGVAVCSMEFSGKYEGEEVNILCPFGQKPSSEQFNHHPFDGTPTDTALWAARAVLMQRTEPRKIILVLTDGAPNYADATKAATAKVVKDGIEVAAIGIMSDAVKHYWRNNRVINGIKDLPLAMFGVMEDLLNKGGSPRA